MVEYRDGGEYDACKCGEPRMEHFELRAPGNLIHGVCMDLACNCKKFRPEGTNKIGDLIKASAMRSGY